MSDRTIIISMYEYVRGRIFFTHKKAFGYDIILWLNRMRMYFLHIKAQSRIASPIELR